MQTSQLHAVGACREADFLLHRGGRFLLADAKWSEHPGARDTAALRRVAGQLPAESVRAMRIFCRTPNEYPLAGGDVRAAPIGPSETLADWI